MTDPIMLAIETSQRLGGVALRDAQGRAHLEWLDPQGRHDDDLVAAIDRLYARLALAPRQTQAIGVSVGPGGFTGLRVAVSAAKMLAETLGAKIVAVPTALVVAESYQGRGPIVVTLASKGDTVWAVRLRRDGEWQPEGDGGLCEAGAIPLEGAEALLGDRYLPPVVTDACARLGVSVVDPVFSPLACLGVAWRLLGQGKTSDALLLSPIYARPPAVTISPRDRYRC
jgi:tRNA threonylcarbamoyl adenosine modification protein YeaZ